MKDWYGKLGMGFIVVAGFAFIVVVGGRPQDSNSVLEALKTVGSNTERIAAIELKLDEQAITAQTESEMLNQRAIELQDNMIAVNNTLNIIAATETQYGSALLSHKNAIEQNRYLLDAILKHSPDIVKKIRAEQEAASVLAPPSPTQ